MDNILVSFIIPVYNVENYVERCIKSVLGCNKFNYECILVNDGSTDNSFAICKKYELYDNVIVINQKNKGLSAARNTGIKSAKGKYIIFIDSDDYIIPQNLDKLMLEIFNNDRQFDFLFNDYFILSEDNFVLENVNQISSQTIVYDNNYVYECINKRGSFTNSWRYVFRADFIRENNLSFKEGYFCEDVDFAVNTFLAARDFASVHIPYYNYIIDRSNSIMNTVSAKRVLDFYIISEDCVNKIISTGNSDFLIIKNKLIVTCILLLPNLWEVPRKERKKIKKFVKGKIKIVKFSNSFFCRLIYFAICIMGISLVSYILYLIKIVKRIIKR